jgi:hypothetical protein
MDIPRCQLALMLNEHQATEHGASQLNNLKLAKARLTPISRLLDIYATCP